MRKYIGKIKLKKCKYCKSKENLTIDHKIPLSQQGTNEAKNLQCLCQRCNEMKSGLSDRQVRKLWNWFLDIQKDREKNNYKKYGENKPVEN